MKTPIINLIARLFCRRPIAKVIMEIDSLAEWEKKLDYYQYELPTDIYYPKHRKYAITTTIYRQNIVAADGKCVYLTSFEKWLFVKKFSKQLDKIEKNEHNDFMAKQMAQFAENN